MLFLEFSVNKSLTIKAQRISKFKTIKTKTITTMPKWGDMSAEDKKKVYDALAAVYEEEGHPEGLGQPGCHGEYVNVLMAK